MYELRPYQTDLVASIRNGFRTSRRVLAVAPTGAGKGVVLAYIATHAAAKGNPVTIVAHRTEIVSQISKALTEMDVAHGRIQPGFEMTDHPVMVAMIQTLARRSDKIKAPNLLVIDEAHHCAADSYDKVCKLWPTAKILGVTATPQRLDGKGLGRAFDVMVIGPTTGDLIKAGWLASYLYLAPPTKVDLSQVTKKMGDFNIDQLGAAVDKPKITGDAIEHYKKHLFPRSAIAFTVRVSHAESVAQQFCEAGIRAASVDGSMDAETRHNRISGLADGRIQVLTSCALISEGLDIPSVGGVILLRPTLSLAMYLQSIGRALRPKLDGSKAVILDHVGNVLRHGTPDADRDWTLDDKQRTKPAPVSTCEVCYRVFRTYPGWQRDVLEDIETGYEIDCDEPKNEDCLLRKTVAGPGVRPPTQVDGNLVEFTSSPEWTKGCDIMRAKGPEFRALLHRADTREKLEQIRKARGYKPFWTRSILLARADRR